jgi:hypothetical protein
LFFLIGVFFATANGRPLEYGNSIDFSLDARVARRDTLPQILPIVRHVFIFLLLDLPRGLLSCNPVAWQMLVTRTQYIPWRRLISIRPDVA